MAVAEAMVAGAEVVAEAVAEVATVGTRMVAIATEVAGGLSQTSLLPYILHIAAAGDWWVLNTGDYTGAAMTGAEAAAMTIVAVAAAAAALDIKTPVAVGASMPSVNNRSVLCLMQALMHCLLPSRGGYSRGGGSHDSRGGGYDSRGGGGYGNQGGGGYDRGGGGRSYRDRSRSPHR